MTAWRWYVAGLVLFGQVGDARAQDCYYGTGRFSVGTIFCQSGQSMQCRKSADGGTEWVSIEQRCDDFPHAGDTDSAASGPHGGGFASAPTAPAPTAAPELAPAAQRAAPNQERGEPPPQSAVVRDDKSAAGDGLVIEILWADYGRDGRSCDAGSAVAQRCNGAESCELAVDDDTLCDAGPVPGLKKLLSVYWRCNENGASSRAKAPAYGEEGDRLELACH